MLHTQYVYCCTLAPVWILRLLSGVSCRGIKLGFAVLFFSMVVPVASVSAQGTGFVYQCYVALLKSTDWPIYTEQPYSDGHVYPTYDSCMWIGQSWCASHGLPSFVRDLNTQGLDGIADWDSEIFYQGYRAETYVRCFPNGRPPVGIPLPAFGARPWQKVVHQRLPQYNRQTLKPPIFVPLPIGPNHTPVFVRVERDSPTGRFLVELEDVMNRAPTPALVAIATALTIGGVVAAVGAAGAAESGGTSLVLPALSMELTGAAILGICALWEIPVHDRGAFEPL
jgi:hypothetical protein